MLPRSCCPISMMGEYWAQFYWPRIHHIFQWKHRLILFSNTIGGSCYELSLLNIGHASYSPFLTCSVGHWGLYNSCGVCCCYQIAQDITASMQHGLICNVSCVAIYHSFFFLLPFHLVVLNFSMCCNSFALFSISSHLPLLYIFILPLPFTSHILSSFYIYLRVPNLILLLHLFPTS